MCYDFKSLGEKEEIIKRKISFKKQHQDKVPGIESIMIPRPIFDDTSHKGTDKLKDKVAVITGGDSGIGRAVAVLFAKEGCDIVIVYLNETEDALETKKCVEKYGRKCLLIQGDLKDEKFSKFIVNNTIEALGKINILVNNCGVQYVKNSIFNISAKQLKNTFETNIFSFFYLTKEVLPFLNKNDCIINTSSINAFRGNEKLIDYSATKGAVTAFTKSLAKSLVNKKVRVNEVAPGPIWTPLIPASFSEDDVEVFGTDTPLRRPAMPCEVAPAYLYLACDDSSYVTGQTIHVNGGTII